MKYFGPQSTYRNYTSLYKFKQYNVIKDKKSCLLFLLFSRGRPVGYRRHSPVKLNNSVSPCLDDCLAE